MDLEDDYGVGGDDDDLKRRRWTGGDESSAGAKAVGSGDWAAVCNTYLGGHGRSPEQCRHRWECSARASSRRVHGGRGRDHRPAMKEGRQLTWMQIAARIPGRIGKQCRERWTNHLDPSLKKGGWTPEEDSIMAEAQTRWGNAWTKIAELLPGRAENAVKNRWNSAFRRNNSAVFGKATGEKAQSAVATRAAMELIDRGDGGARDAGGSGRRRPPAASAWDAAAPPPPRKRASTPPAAPPRRAVAGSGRRRGRGRRRHFHFPPPDAGGAAPDGLDLVILAIESEQASAPPSPSLAVAAPLGVASASAARGAATGRASTRRRRARRRPR
ncbi:RNA polymerase II transcription regulator recruiting protein [Aureococcus anophagefferens]|nr:RNA polymerase II transcription regulator recruiting protein [Aureococcus anophagefferens]